MTMSAASKRRIVTSEIRRLLIVSSACFIVAACRTGPIQVSPSAPGTCPSLQIDYPNQPTAAAAIEGTTGANSNNGHLWGAVDASGNERLLNVDFVPQGGWAVPARTKSIAFSQFTHRPGGGFGVGQMEGRRVDYILEYTLPVAQCDMGVSWDTNLAIELPHGVCVTDDGTPGTCKNGAAVAAKLDMYAVSDPTGTMSVTGAGLAALQTAIDAELSTVVPRRRIAVSSNDTRSIRRTSAFTGSFNVAQGVRPHVYVGVAVLLQKSTDGWACLHKCTTQPTDKLVDAGFLSVDGGRGDGLGVAMARRGP